MSYPTFLTAVEREIRDERDRQDAKWGEQNHPDGTGPDGNRQAMADMARELCQRLAAIGVVTFYHILLEEVYEAMAEEDPARLRAELIQVAAVAAQWVEAIDRRTAR
jgi:type IV pilus biogenesis protein CpaD/CtpE